ncbi:MAG: anti-sigma factor [Acidimicrobiales bacterium]
MSDELALDGDETRVDAILRSMRATDLDLDTPPDSVWAGIQAATASIVITADDADAPETTTAPVIDMESRRRRPVFIGAVAAALAVIAGLAIVLSMGDAEPTELASAQLAYVEGDPAFVELGAGRSAAVTLLEESDTQIVRVDTADLPVVDDENDLELWLIGVNDGQIEVIQTLGIVADPTDPGEFTVPADFDRDAFDTVAVDVSVEPHDGDEAHSGQSIVRGPLTSA